MGVSYTKLASIVAVAAVVGAVVFHQPVNAAPATFTWTGATGDSKMSTAGNWKEGSVPTQGSKLVFKCVDGPNENIQNDLAVVPSGLEVKKLDSLPANKSCAKYTINTMQFTPDAEFTGDQTSADNKDRRKIPFVSINTVIGLSNMKSNGFNGEFKNKPTINRFEFANTGCNEIAESLRAAEKIVGENASVKPEGANSILVKNKGQLEIDEDNNETSASKITFENGAMISHGVHCQPSGSTGGNLLVITTVLSGDIVLNGDVEYKLESMNDVKITGKLSGPGKLIAHKDNKGVVLVESSNNTSGTPNGRYGNVHGPKLIKLDDNKPDDYILIKRGEAVLLNGIRHEVDILEGGMLSGNATLNYLLFVGGVVSPGNNSPGKITTDSLNFGNSGVYKVKILDKDHYDQIVADLGVILDGGSLDLTYLEGCVIKKGDTFTIIDNKGTGPVTGSLAGMGGTFKDLPEGAEITVSGVTFKISYVGGDGNDIVLTALNDSPAPKSSKTPKAPNTGGEKLAVNLIGAIAGVASAVALLIVAKRKSFNKK
ncbi:hypothetical protein LRM42_03185 [Candidatus Nanosynbacter sp. TM7-075]|uniref:hypothetical protein n=1 Tax=Candidatus Nanosynbacter sp. TM7-075 TaxID=2902633 RepID=UPI001FB57147|nr:hypothetical protein [Candidatus Nanosynbacter sp. TM7-075]MCJ1967298.1 hypothetical protein [Candidatus Nanosynbacter sp. TM7-075]